jgi:ferrochelatase
MSRRRIAVVLFNLGGPADLKGVRPFLERLFSDPAIIDLPAVARLPLAAVVARLRARKARANYALMGGASPLLAETAAQAAALQGALHARLADAEVRVVIAMRYDAPMSWAAARTVADFAPDEVVLAPLYPQYSTATTASSLAAWRAVYPGACRAICCWYDNDGLIEAHVRQILTTWEAAGRPMVRLLLSAHGVPLRVDAGGDPYRWQVEATCARLAARLGPDWDWRLCYQSRVGPLKWLGPSTPEAILEAGRDGLGVLIDPIAFVSEHVETLVELDVDYAALAKAAGISVYLRAPAVGIDEAFIDGLAGAVIRALERAGLGPDGAGCPAAFRRCPSRTAEATA